MTALEDGVYFGLDEAEYHAQPRLSSSGIKILVKDPLRFWRQSWLNPARVPEPDTKARALGRAYHKLFLEGDAAFEAAYCVAPHPDEYPGAIIGLEALKERCAQLGLPRSGTTEALCSRILSADPDAVLFADIQSRFQEDVVGKEVLSRDQWLEMQTARFVLDRLPSVRDAFTEGYPEVSILWTTHAGVQMKARLDYLKIRAGYPAILDLKTFANSKGIRPADAPYEEIATHDYFAQPPIYSAAVLAARDLISAGKVFAPRKKDLPKKAWLRTAFGGDEPDFHFIFVQSGGIPNVVPARFSRWYRTTSDAVRQENAHWRKGRIMFEHGVEIFRAYLDRYGTAPWITEFPPFELDETGFKPWSLDTPTADLEEPNE